MIYNFSNKTVIVTGASKGIGKAIALAFGLEGANVVATARSLIELNETVNCIRKNKGTGVAITGDLGNPNDIKRIVKETKKQFGTIDILINNAAIIHPKIDTVDFEDEVWVNVLNVNLTGAFLITKYVLPSMIKQSGGKIINISSIGGRKGARGRSAYRVTKAGLISLTETWAAELQEHNINVNAICPGGTDTEGYRSAFKSKGKQDDPKLMDPKEIAEVALFLSSEKSSAITGTAVDSFGTGNPLFA